MAKIFLSYSREDVAKAKRISRALEAAGHSVWWDRQLHVGERFSAEIDRELKAADVVLVLWSRASIDSVWVHDEAASGRDSGRLMPILLEKVDPPLGFRQFHAINLAGARLKSSDVTEVLNAIGKRTSNPVPVPSHARTQPVFKRRQALVVMAALVVAGLSATGWWIYREGPSSRPSIVIEPASEPISPIGEMMAQSIATNLRRFQAGPITRLEIQPAGSRKSATYRARVSIVEGDGQLTLALILDSSAGSQLWTTTLDAPSNSQSDLQRQAAAKLGAVLVCDLDLSKRDHVMPDEARALYLDGCSRMADATIERDEQAISALRQVTEKAPRFAPGWAKLALAEFSSISSVPSAQRSNVAWSSGRHSDAARRLEPTLPEPFYVRAFNGPWTPASISVGLATITEGLQLNPDSSLLHTGRAILLTSLGRLNEALESAKRAVVLDPLSPSTLEEYIALLAYTGQNSAAEHVLDEADSNWPRSAAVLQARYWFDLRYGDPANALELLRNGMVPGAAANPDKNVELFLKARIKPTPDYVEAALKSYREQFRKERSGAFGYVQALGAFGRVDEAYGVMASLPDEYWSRNEDVLFRPALRAIRSDPRFIGYTNKLGLLAIWKETGKWPDFCKDPQLRYDCQNEAAKHSDPAP